MLHNIQHQLLFCDFISQKCVFKLHLRGLGIIQQTYYFNSHCLLQKHRVLYDQDCYSHLSSGPVTNLAVIPRSSLLPGSNQRRGFGLSILKKYPQPANSSRRDMSITLASPCQVLKEDHNLINCQTTDTHQHIYDMEVSLSLSNNRCYFYGQ